MNLRLSSGGGEEEDRTPDLRIANAALSQLSYPPHTKKQFNEHGVKCVRDITEPFAGNTDVRLAQLSGTARSG